MSQKYPVGSLSLVLAVTGHRDIEGDFRLKDEIEGLFRKLRKDYPCTPLLLLSALAEGADRMVAGIARELQIPYVAVLPMPYELYVEDFRDVQSRTDFDDLLKDAVNRIEIPLASGATRGEVSVPGRARDRQYGDLGRFLAEYSQILIAVWDRESAQRTGGAAHVVNMKLGKDTASGHPRFLRLNADGAGPVYHIAARRKGSTSGPTPAVAFEAEYPEGADPKGYKASYELLHQYNRDVHDKTPAFSKEFASSRTLLFEGEGAIGLSDAMIWVAERYSRADALAIYYSRRSLRRWKTAFLSLAVAGLGLALESATGASQYIWIYVAGLALSLGLMALERYEKTRARHEDYRALAESLRVQFFWMAAGLRNLAADDYLPRQAGEMAWIRDAISECALYDKVLDREPAQPDHIALRMQLARTWVSGQERYFKNTYRKHQLTRRILNGLATALVTCGISLTIWGFTGKSQSASRSGATVAMWWAALAWDYVERRGFASEARQYARMYELFRSAATDLGKYVSRGDFKESEATIRELGRLALTENGVLPARLRKTA